MFFDGDGGLFVQPFSGKVAPTEGDRQQSHEFIDPLRLGQMGILKAKPAALEALKEGFDLPALRISFHRGFRGFIANQDEIFSIR